MEPSILDGEARPMAWIRTVDKADSKGETKRVYDRIVKERGHLANVFQAQGLDPKVLERELDLYVEVMMGEGPLTREERETIAVIVSAANRCAYGAIHHSEALETVDRDPGALYKLAKAYTDKCETPRSKALLAYAAKLTLDPKAITEDDLKDMREAGLTDEEILRASLVAAYFNFSNRLSLGLGVRLEKGEARSYRY
ncbi:MAG: peroxidase-related enzyme [Thermoplasmata archaeon]|nr:peroxidase-related enzyme [Thermoplasmata archaeon]